jgi:molybdate transport system ATP-binding protein
LNTSACRLASWAFVGSNGSGKSALARALSGELTLLSGQRECTFSRITRLSFEQLQKLVSDEWQRNNTDLLSPGEEDTGRTTAEIIQDEFKDPSRCARLAEQFALATCSNAVLNISLPAKRARPCCARR